MNNVSLKILGMVFSMCLFGCESYDSLDSSTSSSASKPKSSFFTQNKRRLLSTGYKPYRAGLGGQLGKGGYSHTMLQPNVAKVKYVGNGGVYSEESSDYCLLRCAEIAKENGFRYFIILEENNIRNEVGAKTYSSTGSIRSLSSNLSKFNAQTTQNKRLSEPASIRVIRMFPDQPESGPIAYEVDFLIKSLKEKYGIN